MNNKLNSIAKDIESIATIKNSRGDYELYCDDKATLCSIRDYLKNRWEKLGLETRTEVESDEGIVTSTYFLPEPYSVSFAFIGHFLTSLGTNVVSFSVSDEEGKRSVDLSAYDRTYLNMETSTLEDVKERLESASASV